MPTRKRTKRRTKQPAPPAPKLPPRLPTMTGEELRELLERHGVSQSAMAREIGINDRTIRRYLKAELVPVSIEYAAKWAIYIRRHGDKTV